MIFCTDVQQNECVSGDDRQPQSQRNDRAAPDGDDHRASEIYDGYALHHACPPQLIPIESRPQAPVEPYADREEQPPPPGIPPPRHLPPPTSNTTPRSTHSPNNQTSQIKAYSYFPTETED